MFNGRLAHDCVCVRLCFMQTVFSPVDVVNTVLAILCYRQPFSFPFAYFAVQLHCCMKHIQLFISSDRKKREKEDTKSYPHPIPYTKVS